MCGCEAHWNSKAFCSCNCPEHKNLLKVTEYRQQPEND